MRSDVCVTFVFCAPSSPVRKRGYIPSCEASAMLGSMYGSLMGLVSGGCPCALDEDGKSRLVSSGVLSSRVLSSRVVLCLILSCSSATR